MSIKDIVGSFMINLGRGETLILPIICMATLEK